MWPLPVQSCKLLCLCGAEGDTVEHAVEECDKLSVGRLLWRAAVAGPGVGPTIDEALEAPRGLSKWRASLQFLAYVADERRRAGVWAEPQPVVGACADLGS